MKNSPFWPILLTVLASALFFLLAHSARADVPFLMVFQERGWRQWTVIPLALFIELIVLVHFFDMPWKKAILADLSMNAASAFIGALPTTGPLGVAWDVIALLRIYMFRGVIEVAGTIIVVGFIDAIVEYGVLRFGFSQTWTWKRAIALLTANLATGAIIFSSFWLPSNLLEGFIGAEDGRPAGGLTADNSGSLYGGTSLGGHSGNGVVFKLTPLDHAPAGRWAETVLHSFAGGAEGVNPQGLIFDKSGALYGTTERGGNSEQGTVFKLMPPAGKEKSWTLVTLYSFTGGNDGGRPHHCLLLGKDGALYGATQNLAKSNRGVVFKLSPPVKEGMPWTLTILYRFSGGNNGDAPNAGLAFDETGVLYGTTNYGGALWKGSVFKLTPPPGGGTPWAMTVLYSFPPLSDGREGYPFPGALIRDKAGALYGTSVNGGAFGRGAVFKLTPPSGAGKPWTETTLHSFTGGRDSRSPTPRLVFDRNGALYGGTYGEVIGEETGMLFKLTPPAPEGGPWDLSILYKFSGGKDGKRPTGDLILENSGALYGTALGGRGADTVFRLMPPASGGTPWVLTTLHYFRPAP